MSQSHLAKRIFGKIRSNTEISFSVAYTAIIRVLGVALRFAVVVAISRQIGAEQFGIYTYVTQLMAMVALISFFGADQYLLKVIPPSARTRQAKMVSESASSVAIIGFVSSAVAVLALVAIAKASDAIPRIYAAETVLGSLMVFPMLFLFFQNALLRANHNPASSQIFENIVNPIATLSSFLTLAWWAKERHLPVTADEVLLATIISYYFVSAIGLHFLYRKVCITPTFSLKAVLATLRELAPLCLFVLLYQLFSRLPILAIGHFLGAIDVARYFAASRVAELIEFPLGIVSIVYISKYSALNALERDKKQRILRDASIVLLVSSLLIYTVLFYLSDHIFRLFGDGMTESHEVYVVLGLGYAVASVTGFVDFALIRAGHSATVNISLLLSTALMAASLIALPIATPRDVALIYAFSWVFNKLLMAYCLWKTERLSVIPVIPLPRANAPMK